MQSIKFLDTTQSLGKPEGWDADKDGVCSTLPVNITFANDRPLYLSVWSPTDEERARIADGENITLTCVGLQPPVLLTVANIQPATDEDIAAAKAAAASVEDA